MTLLTIITGSTINKEKDLQKGYKTNHESVIIVIKIIFDIFCKLQNRQKDDLQYVSAIISHLNIPLVVKLHIKETTTIHYFLNAFTLFFIYVSYLSGRYCTYSTAFNYIPLFSQWGTLNI